MSAFRLGRGIVTLAVLLIGLGLTAVEKVLNAVEYTEVPAIVEGVDKVCNFQDRPATEQVDCRTTPQNNRARRLLHHTAVRVRYQSPTGGGERSGVVIPIGGQSAVDAINLHPGDQWRILAHDTVADRIKAK